MNCDPKVRKDTRLGTFSEFLLAKSGMKLGNNRHFSKRLDWNHPAIKSSSLLGGKEFD